MIIPNIQENKKCSKPATQQHSLVSANMASRENLSKCKFIAGENQLPVVDFCNLFYDRRDLFTSGKEHKRTLFSPSKET